MDREKEFIKHICKELEDENVAVFAGAGMSARAGYVNWVDLLRPIADELGLNIEKEHDLVALAQYHCNVNGNNRSQLNQRLIEEFSKSTIETETHRILSRLPIRTYWTTNYDKLIENFLSKSGRLPDVKYTKQQLAFTKPKRNAVVYKMHGDVDHPNDAVLTKDDYEKYHVKMDQYLSSLKGDLISKTFIFIGFSFTDPNIDYILSRVRVAYDGNQRRHYCFIKSTSRENNESEADFLYRKRKQDLFVGDLNRFNIKAVLIDDYNEIEQLLKLIEINYKKNTVFISGAAHDYGHWGEVEAPKFVSDLSAMLIRGSYKIVSGFGKGIGSSVISGALEEVYIRQGNAISDQLILRPFPQSSSSQPLSQLWTQYRQDMISRSGFTVLLFGNKIVDGCSVLSDGMREEYEISKSNNNTVLPIGATGFMAKQLWEEEYELLKAHKDVDDKYVELFEKLGDGGKSPKDILDVILEIINHCIDKGGA